MARPKARLNRKEDILLTAQKLFRENSYEKTTVDDIANNAGISKESVYLEFKTKEDIFYCILESYFKSQIEKFAQVVENSKPPYLNVLKDFLINDVMTTFDLMGDGYKNCEALIYTNEKVKNKLMPLFNSWSDLSLCLLEKAKSNNEIDPKIDCKQLARTMDIASIGFYTPNNYYSYYTSETSSSQKLCEIRNTLKKDVSFYLGIIISGLKVN